MRHPHHRLRAILLIAGCATASLHFGAHAATLDDAAWLTGCWTLLDAAPGSGEQWMAPAGGMMLGMSRTVRDGRPTQFEFMQIRTDAEHELVLIAQPGGAAPTVFPLKAQQDGVLLFEQPAHDFPQRVQYRRLSEDRVSARIDGDTDDGPLAIDFELAREACDAAVRR